MDVTLIKAHTHEGIDHAPGSTIAVGDNIAQWLAENGVIAAKITPVAALINPASPANPAKTAKE